MNSRSMTAITRAENACAACREQKRGCDKLLPSCGRCTRQNRSCNYLWHSTSDVSPSEGLTFLLRLELDNPKAPSLDIDLLYVNMLHQAQEEHSSAFTLVMYEYFCNQQSWLPVVMERPFKESLEKLGHQPHAETALLALVILLVVQGGLPDRATNPSHRNYILCKELYAVLQLRRAPSLQLVQSGLLIALYETGKSSSGAASLTIASCARLGYLMKLNIDDGNDYEDYLSWEAAEERRRVWTGIYLLDRVIYQVVTEFKAPHVSEDLADHFRLPVDDACLRTDKSEATQAPSHQPMSVPVDVPLCYYAREIQAVRLLGEVQLLQRHIDVNSLPEKFQILDHRLMQFAERLFEQTPQGWATLCGANAITLTAALTLHRIRIDCAVKLQTLGTSDAKASLLALTSFINMVRDICNKFNMLSAPEKIPSAPLPAVMCTGEAVLAGIKMKELLGEQFQLDYEPFRLILLYARKTWKLADQYLQQMDNRSILLMAQIPVLNLAQSVSLKALFICATINLTPDRASFKSCLTVVTSLMDPIPVPLFFL